MNLKNIIYNMSQNINDLKEEAQEERVLRGQSTQLKKHPNAASCRS